MEPQRKEILPTQGALDARIRQLGASIVPEHSDDQKALYWSKRHQVWMLVTPHRNGGVLVGYYPMEQCPCGG